MSKYDIMYYVNGEKQVAPETKYFDRVMPDVISSNDFILVFKTDWAGDIPVPYSNLDDKTKIRLFSDRKFAEYCWYSYNSTIDLLYHYKRSYSEFEEKLAVTEAFKADFIKYLEYMPENVQLAIITDTQINI